MNNIILTDHTPSKTELQRQHNALRRLFWLLEANGTSLLVSCVSGALGDVWSGDAYYALYECEDAFAEPLADIMDAMGRRMDELKQELKK